LDNHDILDAEREMTKAIQTMESQLASVAMARQVVDFAGERRKTSLSRIVVEHLNADKSGTESEHRARADERYKQECQTIMKQTAEAEKIIMQNDIARHKFEAARSILSVRRAQIGMI
jgi:hypothetical protein